MKSFLTIILLSGAQIWSANFARAQTAVDKTKADQLTEQDPGARRFRRNVDEDYMKRSNLAAEVPVNADDYIWKVTGMVGGVEVFKSEVPLYAEPGDFRLGIIGSIPIDREVVLSYFTVYRGRNFFEVPLTGAVESTTPVKTAWIDGIYLKYAGKRGK